MPPAGQGGWGGGGGNGGGEARRGGNRGGANVQGREEIRKFLNFYKRKNSVCVDLYQPAFYAKKPNWEDMAEFVYSVLSVGSVSGPQLIRAAVRDVQLHPVKKLLFMKFTDKSIRDEVAARLQTGLVWPAFDTTVSGWAMDKPVERIRVLGASPETDEAGVRSVLEQFGEILEARKGLISPKKLPGCTNGIWTVKLILEENKLLPPFLIMKEEGEVWQLATGEISVCWKCGLSGHIGDRCHQDVSALAASLASPSNCQQPSWAHVVRGALPQPHVPPAPLMPMPTQVGKLTASVTAAALVQARSRLTKQYYQAADLAASWWVSAYKSDKAGIVHEEEVVGDTFVEHGNQVDGTTTSQSARDQQVEAVTNQSGGQGCQGGGDKLEGSTDSQEQLASGDEMVNLSMEVQVSLNADNPEDGNMIS